MIRCSYSVTHDFVHLDLVGGQMHWRALGEQILRCLHLCLHIYFTEIHYQTTQDYKTVKCVIKKLAYLTNWKITHLLVSSRLPSLFSVLDPGEFCAFSPSSISWHRMVMKSCLTNEVPFLWTVTFDLNPQTSDLLSSLSPRVISVTGMLCGMWCTTLTNTFPSCKINTGFVSFLSLGLLMCSETLGLGMLLPAYSTSLTFCLKRKITIAVLLIFLGHESFVFVSAVHSAQIQV